MTDPRAKKQKAYRGGLWAETLAAWVLRLKGFRILERRYKCPSGEIDLIARRRHLLVFVEVKHRANLNDAAFAIHETQMRRIHKAAETYLTRKTTPANLRLRFDAILVAPSGRFRHLANAWQP
ncbi:MAG: YraN family protein [Alphaproteobacteria bacterium]|nr:MAG: YraN family protein [Alphaproteobacteria bacterium]